MGGNTLELDNVISAVVHFAIKWTPELDHTKARDLLRFLICRLHDCSRGNLHTARLQLSQVTLAEKLNLSRRWVGVLTQRLEAAGWIEHYSPVLPDGTNGPTWWRIGRQLKRMIVMLLKSQRGKRPMRKPANSRWQFSPLKAEKEASAIRAKEKAPPREEQLAKMPLLKTWLMRGGGEPVAG